jgi:uncharacterized protein YjbJ (UPF0337 family)
LFRGLSFSAPGGHTAARIRRANGPAVKLQSNGGNTMKSSTKNRTTGKLHQFTGKLKEVVGRLTKSRKLEAEGRTEKTAGKVQDKIGQVEKVIGK